MTVVVGRVNNHDLFCDNDFTLRNEVVSGCYRSADQSFDRSSLLSESVETREVWL